MLSVSVHTERLPAFVFGCVLYLTVFDMYELSVLRDRFAMSHFAHLNEFTRDDLEDACWEYIDDTDYYGRMVEYPERVTCLGLTGDEIFHVISVICTR